MHKKESGDGVKLIPKFQYGTGQGGVNTNVGSSWIQQNAPSWAAGFSGAMPQFGGIMKDQTTSSTAGISPGSASGFNMNKAIGGGLAAALSGITNINGIQSNKSLTGVQKNMMTADASVDAVGQGLSALGPLGGAIGQGLGLVNKLGGALIKTPQILKDFKVDDTVNQSSGFTGTAANASEMVNNASTYKNAGLIGKLFGKKNKLVQSAQGLNEQQSQVNGILRTSEEAKQRGAAGANMLATNNNNTLYAGNMWNNGSVQYGMEGMKIAESGSSVTKTYEQYKKLLGAACKLDLKKIKAIKPVAKLKVEPHVPNLAEGGTLNVIVDGKLHAHKHTLKDLEHLEDANITLKGVPVVSNAEGGEIVQHAEVEKDELIMHLDLSKRLEELYEDGSEEAMIKAGKLLAKELCKNTKDSSSGILENA